MSSNLSKVSIYNYQSDIKSFILWLQKSNLSSGNIAYSSFVAYLGTLTSSSNTLSIKRKLSSLRKFLAFLVLINDITPAVQSSIDTQIQAAFDEIRKHNLKNALIHELKDDIDNINSLNEVFNALT